MACGCREAAVSATTAGARIPDKAAGLSAEPVLDIGAADGTQEYLLHNAVSSLRRNDGGVVVLNAGSHQLRYYDASGRHVRSVGTKGNGPGEFRRPVKLYAAGGDSVVVLDPGTSLETLFDNAGEFVRASPHSPDTTETFPRESWLYGRAWVEGPQAGADREPVRQLLDGLPSLSGTRAYRRVLVDAHSRVWVRAITVDSAASPEWDVYGLDGEPLARVATPAGFEVQQIGADFLLGRGRDSLNVEHIQLYSMNGLPPGRRPASVQPAPPATPVGAPTLARLERMKEILRHAMAQQEMFYSRRENGYRYADRASLLKWPDDMGGMVVQILDGGAMGWTALLFHEAEPFSCGVTVGISGPVGWTPGIILC
jgi:hypothetical protein